MTLSETIEYYEKKAKELEQNAKLHQRPDKGVKGSGKRYLSCIECAEKNRQLAEWLKALKEIWDSGDCNDCRNGRCEWKPKLGHLVRYNCPHYVGIANGEVNADETYS